MSDVKAAVVGLALLFGVAPALAAPPSPKPGEHPVWVRIAPAGPFDHLVPDHSVWSGGSPRTGDDYADIVRSAMPEIFAPTVRARMIVLHFMPDSEHGLALESVGSKWRIRGAHSQDWLWRFSQAGREQAWDLDRQRVRREDYRKVGIRRCSIWIDNDVANYIVGVWNVMIDSAHSVRFDSPRAADAPLIYYVANVVGKIHGAVPPVYAGKGVTSFMAIGVAMGNLCERPTQANRRALKTVVKAVPLVLP